MNKPTTYCIAPLSVFTGGESLPRLSDRQAVYLSDRHPGVVEACREADVLILRDLVDPDFLPIMTERREQSKETVFEWTGSGPEISAPPGELVGLGEPGHLLRLLLHRADRVRFGCPSLLETYGILNPGSSVIDDRGCFSYDATPFEMLLDKGCRLKRVRPREALDCFAKAERLSPESYLSPLLKSVLAPDPAASLRKALRLNPQSLNAWILLAEAYLRLNDWRSALQAVNSAAQLAPDYAAPYCLAARIMRLLKRKNDWLSLIRKSRSCLSALPQRSAAPKEKRSFPKAPVQRTKRVLLMALERSMLFHDCRDAFTAMGWEARGELFGDRTHEEHDAHERLVLRMRSFDPHLVFSINHAGCDREGFVLAALKDAGIPAVLWYVDNPFALLPEDLPSMVRDAALLASFDSSYVDGLRERTGVESIHLPLGTNPERFQPSHEEAAGVDWRVSFIGNLDLARAARRREDAIQENPSAARWIDRAVEAMMGAPFSSAHRALSALDALPGWNDLPLDLRGKIILAAEAEASARRRLEIVTRLGQERIRVIGGSEWKTHVGQRQWVPPVNYLTGLCRLYQRSRINLNISRYQLRAGVNQRVFDVPAAGGFLLTDRTSELERYLEPGEEIIFYEDSRDLKEKVSYYLAHDRQRKEMARKARSRVLSEHTYGHRMKRVIAALGLH